MDGELGTLFEMMSSRMPWRPNMCWMSREAVSMAEGNLGRWMEWTDLENQLTMVRMTVLTLEERNPGQCGTKGASGLE